MTTTFSKIKKKMAVQNLELPIFDILPETVIDYQQLLSMSTQKLTSGPWTTYSMVPCIWSEVKWSEVAQLCPTLCDPMDCSLPGSSVYGIFQARILEWVAISFSRRSSPPRDWTQVSCIVDRRFTIWATREVPWCHVYEKTQKIFETYMCQLPW